MAEPHNSQATLGSTGRDVRVVECPAGEVLKGFVGRKGAGIDQLQMLCAPLLWDGTTGATHAVGDAYGGFGGGPFPANACSPASRIAAAHVALIPDNKMVAGLALTCVRKDGSVEGQVYFYGTAVISGGRAYDGVSNDFSDYRYGAIADYSCPDESFIGMRIRFDTAVRGLGMLCDARTPPPAPAPTPIPAKPIKSTHRGGPTTSSGSAVAPRATIAGLWDFAASGHNSRVQIIAQGTGLGINGADINPIQVNGIMTDSEGNDDHNGGFAGMLQADRQMIVNYSQKNGDSGTCQLFYSADAKAIAGTCVDQDKNTFQWHGTRSSGDAPAPPRLDRAALHAVTVKLDVDVYPAAGGGGQSIGSLNAGTEGVTLVEACRDNWCHVRWPGHEGWVYSGPDYNALNQ